MMFVIAPPLSEFLDSPLSSNTLMMSTYPENRTDVMQHSVPVALVVPGGTLLYHPNRDARFPYVYQV